MIISEIFHPHLSLIYSLLFPFLISVWNTVQLEGFNSFFLTKLKFRLSDKYHLVKHIYTIATCSIQIDAYLNNGNEWVLIQPDWKRRCWDWIYVWIARVFNETMKSTIFVELQQKKLIWKNLFLNGWQIIFLRFPSSKWVIANITFINWSNHIYGMFATTKKVVFQYRSISSCFNTCAWRN